VLAGEIGFAHFAYIARASAAVGERLDETTLLRHARKEGVAKFRETCIHARHAADPRGLDEEVQGVEMRELTLTDTDDGLVAVSGTLDKVGARLCARRWSLSRSEWVRTTGVAILGGWRMRGRVLDERAGPLAASGHDLTRDSSRLTGAPAAEMEFSLPISSKAVERLACDCSVTASFSTPTPR